MVEFRDIAPVHEAGSAPRPLCLDVGKRCLESLTVGSQGSIDEFVIVVSEYLGTMLRDVRKG